MALLSLGAAGMVSHLPIFHRTLAMVNIIGYICITFYPFSSLLLLYGSFIGCLHLHVVPEGCRYHRRRANFLPLQTDMLAAAQYTSGAETHCSCATVTETAYPSETPVVLTAPTGAGAVTETTPTGFVTANTASISGETSIPTIGSSTLIVSVSSETVEVPGTTPSATGTVATVTGTDTTATGTDTTTTVPTESGTSASVTGTETMTSATGSGSLSVTSTATVTGSSTSIEPSASEAPPTESSTALASLPTGAVNMGVLLGGAALVAMANQL